MDRAPRRIGGPIGSLVAKAFGARGSDVGSASCADRTAQKCGEMSHDDAVSQREALLQSASLRCVDRDGSRREVTALSRRRATCPSSPAPPLAALEVSGARGQFPIAVGDRTARWWRHTAAGRARRLIIAPHPTPELGRAALGRAGFAPAGRKTKFHGLIASSIPQRPAGPGRTERLSAAQGMPRTNGPRRSRRGRECALPA
jgi:hypothetical protein